jgi:hypothetical protein
MTQHPASNLTAKLTELGVPQMLNAENDSYAKDKEDQRRQASLRIEEHQPKKGEERANGIQQNYNLALTEAAPEQHVMDVAPIPGKKRIAAQKAPDERQPRFNHR